MQFLVTRLRVKGVRLPDKEWIHAPAVSGDVITHWVQDELSGDWIVQATIYDRTKTRNALLPELNRVQIGLISPLALVLRGYERQRARTGFVDFFQEWLLRPVNH